MLDKNGEEIKPGPTDQPAQEPDSAEPVDQIPAELMVIDPEQVVLTARSLLPIALSAPHLFVRMPQVQTAAMPDISIEALLRGVMGRAADFEMEALRFRHALKGLKANKPAPRGPRIVPMPLDGTDGNKT